MLSQSRERKTNTELQPIDGQRHLRGLPEQRKAVEYGIDGNAESPPALLIAAGVGTGKTKAPAHRVAHLILNGGDPRRLLVTFTRRAALEMTRRAQLILAQDGKGWRADHRKRKWGRLAAFAVSGEVTMQGTENAAALLGRVAMSVILIFAGWGKLLAPAATQAMLASHHLPMVQLGWILAVVVELGGGLAILLGLFSRPVGLVLVIWCVATALIAHTNFADRNQEINFLTNMAMTGGFLYVAAFGARAWKSRRMVVAPRRRSGAVGRSPRMGSGYKLRTPSCREPEVIPFRKIGLEAYFR